MNNKVSGKAAASAATNRILNIFKTLRAHPVVSKRELSESSLNAFNALLARAKPSSREEAFLAEAVSTFAPPGSTRGLPTVFRHCRSLALLASAGVATQVLFPGVVTFSKSQGGCLVASVAEKGSPATIPHKSAQRRPSRPGTVQSRGDRDSRASRASRDDRDRRKNRGSREEQNRRDTPSRNHHNTPGGVLSVSDQQAILDSLKLIKTAGPEQAGPAGESSYLDAVKGGRQTQARKTKNPAAKSAAATADAAVKPTAATPEAAKPTTTTAAKPEAAAAKPGGAKPRASKPEAAATKPEGAKPGATKPGAAATKPGAAATKPEAGAAATKPEAGAEAAKPGTSELAAKMAHALNPSGKPLDWGESDDEIPDIDWDGMTM